MFGIPKFWGFRGRQLNLAISSLGSLDFLYVLPPHVRAFPALASPALR